MMDRIIITISVLALMHISAINSLSAATDGSIDPDSAKIGGFNKIRMTSIAFGGSGILFSKVNNQFGVMTGGRGSATFNNRFTFGGAGWGMFKGIETFADTEVIGFFKFGYGGIEFGYIFHQGQKVRFGSNLLTAFGIGFQEKYPKSAGEVRMFPVFEPSLYTQIGLGRLLKLDIGITYRFVTGSKFTFMNNRMLSGPSVYIAFLVGTCKCN